jgi:glutathione reductase (NADPH)
MSASTWWMATTCLSTSSTDARDGRNTWLSTTTSLSSAAGPGGCARRASRHPAAPGGAGRESRMGGTCVIRGCVPKKLMVFASSYREGFADARSYGWDVEDGRSTGRASGPSSCRARPSRRGLPPAAQRLGSWPPSTSARRWKIRIPSGWRRVHAHGQAYPDRDRRSPGASRMPNAHLGIVSDDIFNLETLAQAAPDRGRRLHRLRVRRVS